MKKKIALIICFAVLIVGVLTWGTIYIASGTTHTTYDAKYWCQEYIQECFGDYEKNYYTIDEMKVIPTNNTEESVVFHIYEVFGVDNVCWVREYVAVLTYKSGCDKNDLKEEDIISFKIMQEHNGAYRSYN